MVVRKISQKGGFHLCTRKSRPFTLSLFWDFQRRRRRRKLSHHDGPFVFPFGTKAVSSTRDVPSFFVVVVYVVSRRERERERVVRRRGVARASFGADWMRESHHRMNRRSTKTRTVGISTLVASANSACNSSTVVDHGMLPTYKRLAGGDEAGCCSDIFFFFFFFFVFFGCFFLCGSFVKSPLFIGKKKNEKSALTPFESLNTFESLNVRLFVSLTKCCSLSIFV